jgi:hypothetical protein
MRDRPAFPRRKSNHSKNKKNTNSFDEGPRTGRLKAIIRSLPSTLTREDELKKALGQEWMAKIDWIRFFPGSEGYERCR